MNLYEMTAAANNLYELLTASEIDEQIFKDTLEAMGTSEKLESYCKIIRQLEADAETFKAEKVRFADKQKTAENSVERMKLAIINFMKAEGKEKEKTNLFAISLSKSKAVEITDEKKIPTQYLIEQAPKIDKSSIRAELMAGGEVAGAVLKINEGVRIK